MRLAEFIAALHAFEKTIGNANVVIGADDGPYSFVPARVQGRSLHPAGDEHWEDKGDNKAECVVEIW
ncbi:MAG: hypothetical protein HQ582_06130 [Planctomycetes bacterium]|nr:hypothetical protein [Planctomycetota bacterium]